MCGMLWFHYSQMNVAGYFFLYIVITASLSRLMLMLANGSQGS